MPTHEKLNALRQFADIEQHQKLSLLLASKPSSPSSRASESRVRDPFKVTGSFHVFKTQDGRQDNQFGCNSFSSFKSRSHLDSWVQIATPQADSQELD
jgi:hypothetical protein